MQRILLTLLTLLIAITATGCDLFDPQKGGGGNPPEEENSPVFEEVTVPDRNWMFIPAPGRFVTIEADIRVADGVKRVFIKNIDGDIKADTVLTEPVQSLSFIRDVEIAKMSDGRLTITAEGVTGVERYFLSLNVKEELVISLGREEYNRSSLYQVDWKGGFGEAEAQSLYTFPTFEHPRGFGVSPDGSHFLVFDFQPDSECYHPLILNYKGEVAEDLGEKCEITSTPESVAWSADGRTVAFVTFDRVHGSDQVFTLDLETEEYRQLTEKTCSIPFEPWGGEDSCFEKVSGLAYSETGELHATRLFGKRDGEKIVMFADLARLSLDGGSHERLLKFPEDQWNPSLRDIRNGVVLADVASADLILDGNNLEEVGKSYGYMLIDLSNPEGYEVSEVSAHQFSFAGDDKFLGIYKPEGPPGAPDGDVIFYDRSGNVVAGPYWVPTYYMVSPRLITTEEVGTLH